MKKIVLVTEKSAKAGRPEYYEYLKSLNGAVGRDINDALLFDDEAHIKSHRIMSTFVMFKYDGEKLDRIGYLM